ncbi:SDR family NAD(P)-dependent oxidoreductase [Autumnicola musiva]|uniref:SDR family NAD(P)-dependent oxidoreductase n=1 Tax=Autumnicola musiva TaxID=3075589 RepID=A0ABU3D0Y6_9FLAO|nr:SDR family NAD(P)-dependent oxidoreductase [Zunongwangia sp. F117]MDT0675195.1 SDR family NAD(P)-dependent oxidoreductase [Zunongwangia sp. F117]
MNISILGCGWLGFPLAKVLLDNAYSIKGSTTSREKIVKLQEKNISPYQIKLFAEGVQGDLTSFLSHSEILIIDIPPRLRSDPEADFTGKIKKLLSYIKKSSIKNVIFVSSTSVYKDTEEFPEYTEASAPNGTSRAAVEIISTEKMLKETAEFNTTIIRFGGLLGNDRHPVNFLSGKTGLKNPKAPVNLIQQEDCIDIITRIIKKEAWGTVFNAVYPNHPDKESYYTKKDKINNLALPEYDHSLASKGKIIKSERLQEMLDFEFQHEI